MTLTVGSLFSGVGGFDLGFARAGFDVRWQCESDKRCRSVLVRNFPDTEVIYGNVETIDRHLCAPVDVICGGFPCQDISVAGRRAGLAGDRSGLWWQFRRVLAEFAPEWVVIENVPGLLSSGKRRDMGAVLGALGELGYGWAYRVLDAQYDGLAQRRERVFIVGHLGDGRATEVLFEPDSVPGDHPPRRREREDAAGLSSNGPAHGRISQSLTGRTGGVSGKERQETIIAAPVAATLSAGGHPNSNEPGRRHEDDTNLVVSFTERSRAEGRHFEMQTEVAYALTNPGNGGRTHSRQIAGPFGVRRLMPVECERLQGFPDHWTRYEASGKEIKDGPRYRMLGNAVAVPVAEWIARRILAVTA